MEQDPIKKVSEDLSSFTIYHLQLTIIMKLWQKDKVALKEVEKFTVGNDRELDMYLAPFDVLGSLAHIKMLQSIGFLTKEELAVLEVELKNIYQQITY